jgi:hypothetical protein
MCEHVGILEKKHENQASEKGTKEEKRGDKANFKALKTAEMAHLMPSAAKYVMHTAACVSARRCARIWHRV